MGKKIYVVRHCQAKGQEVEAELTDEGVKQARKLVEFFSKIKVDRIISSPYRRAIDSVGPLAKEKDLSIEMDDRLSERVLSTQFFTDWREKLKATFEDLDIEYPGGESSRQAMSRGLEVIQELSEGEQVILATHGGLTSLILKSFQPNFRFEDWENLTNPDVYLLDYQNEDPKIIRLWK
ncbi:histidine phosphatase family protein [Ornithinibacillus sp. 179-J 7C1 HS]|uniref:histidine phosphatase family protein n=1 Tax=Ornithinibacillus sp. 179-J 7C1 HS TaxID=3142384 RepID=UPI0039A0E4A1